MDDFPYKYNSIDPNMDLKMTKILKKKLNKIATEGCLKMVFTRFPYYNTKLQCKHLALKYNEGNCVAFAYYIKHLLSKHDIKGYIVGSKPPPKFSRDGYKEISHAAVIVPYEKGFILFDTSFYFNKAIILDNIENYEVSHNFTNVYSKIKDKWTFIVMNDKIVVKINDTFVNSYYQLKELMNPQKSITIHTNNADRVVFRCEIDRDFVSKLYYKINLYDNTLSVTSKHQEYVREYLSHFIDLNKLDKKKLKTWIYNLNLNKGQKHKMFTDVSIFLLYQDISKTETNRLMTFFKGQ
jgi:hypothetical protein